MAPITPCLWFDAQAEEAAKLYTSVFRNSAIGTITRYPRAAEAVSGKKAGSVMTVEFTIGGQPFVGLNGGPTFTINPSISFMVNFDSSRDADASQHLEVAWKRLSEKGTVLMPLNEYPWSKRYGWIQDRYGVSWQLMLTNPKGEERPLIVPSLLFVGKMYGKAEAALAFYRSVFTPSTKGTLMTYGSDQGPNKKGTLMFGDVKLLDTWVAAMDGGGTHAFHFTEGISLSLSCKNQHEVDHYWDRLTEGGAESQCGWLKDKFGVSWQVTPTRLNELMHDKDRARANRVMQAMLTMKKIDIATLEKAASAS